MKHEKSNVVNNSLISIHLSNIKLSLSDDEGKIKWGWILLVVSLPTILSLLILFLVLAV